MNWGFKNILETLLIIALFTFSCISINAQNLNKIEKQAVKDFDQGNFVKARDELLVLYNSERRNNVISSYLASCYLELDEPLKSYEILTKISDPDPVNQYLMILTQYDLENFDEASRLINEFPSEAEGYDIDELNNKIARAKSEYGNDKGILVQNFGPDINSKDLEYSAVMYNDYNKLLFTSRKASGPIIDVDGLAFESIYFTQVDQKDVWRKATPFNVEKKDQRSHDATVQVYDDGNKIIFYHDGQLYSSSLKDGFWTKDEDLVLHDKKGSDTHCYISSDEKTIIFASDYYSEGAQLDLFVSKKQSNGKWSNPEPLSVFNTEADEDSPFLANDSTFYFSSNGHNTMGGYDVFKSTYDRVTQQWSEPENMGYPINTVADDLYFTTEGRLAYLSSNRLGGYGSLDLYRIFLFNKVRVKGRLLDDNQQPIADAEIDVKYDGSNLKGYTDANGDYELFVPVNKKMHVTFIKDSLNLFEGDYIANITFEDENHNEFNFFIDYSEKNSGLTDESQNKVVNHINVEVKNDAKNPILAAVPENMENQWSDSLTYLAQKKQKEDLETREIFIASKKDEEKVDIQSSHLTMRDATIHTNVKKQPSVLGGDQSIQTVERQVSSSGTYTVQILAMARLKADQSYFEKIKPSPIGNKNGKDGFNRYFIGEYKSLEDAIEAMDLLRKEGYSDAFVRRLDKYAEF
ncbi:MAG: SPOR domain-containing protein [Bacteroidota bacterium]